MNQRELSEKLEALAVQLENLDNVYQAQEVADELRKLSNENYAPGNGLSWGAVAPKSTKKGFYQSGKKSPF